MATAQGSEKLIRPAQIIVLKSFCKKPTGAIKFVHIASAIIPVTVVFYKYLA